MKRTTILPLLSGILVFLFAQYSPTMAQTRDDVAQAAKKAVSTTQGRTRAARKAVSTSEEKRRVTKKAVSTRQGENNAAARVESKGLHRLALQVNSNDPAAMNLALNNASNVAQHYQEIREPIQIEIVAYGPGLHMLRDDTSPVKPRLKSISESIPTISFKACGNTQQNMQKVEAKEIPLVAQATVVKSGVVRLMELQEQGWSYIRP
jgi:intracellular sulfur oxidation DsrE/DsrF family protein